MSEGTAAREAQGCRLPDGRWLAYAEYGDPRGLPILYFHGFPGSRLEAQLADAAAARLGIRLIAPDRPGFGRSDFHPARRIPDWPGDVSVLADHLALGRFAVLGVSGGAPYALVCAAQLGARVTVAAGVGALAPLGMASARDMPTIQRVGLGLARCLPLGVGAFFGLVGWAIRRHPARVLAYIASSANAADRAVLLRSPEREGLITSFQESVRVGSRGCAHELELFVRPWGFAFEAIGTEVLLWHGEQDAIVPVAMGRALARALPRCRAHFLPGEGHYSVPLDHSAAILAALVKAVT
jgi:pimeloyl-ACP methyl ester carboxylesterase